MFVLITVLLILIEILIASWIIFFIIKLDNKVVLINESISGEKYTIAVVFAQYRKVLEEINKKTDFIKKEEKNKKILSIINTIAFSLLLKNKFM